MEMLVSSCVRDLDSEASGEERLDVIKLKRRISLKASTEDK